MGLIRGLLSVAFIAIAGAAQATACEFVDPNAAQLASLDTSTMYLIAAVAAAAAVVALQAYRRRWSPVMLGVTAILLILHPRWTVSPSYGASCDFVNVQASIAVLAALSLLLAIEVFKTVRSR